MFNETHAMDPEINTLPLVNRTSNPEEPTVMVANSAVSPSGSLGVKGDGVTSASILDSWMHGFFLLDLQNHLQTEYMGCVLKDSFQNVASELLFHLWVVPKHYQVNSFPCVIT